MKDYEQDVIELGDEIIKVINDPKMEISSQDFRDRVIAIIKELHKVYFAWCLNDLLDSIYYIEDSLHRKSAILFLSLYDIFIEYDHHIKPLDGDLPPHEYFPELITRFVACFPYEPIEFNVIEPYLKKYLSYGGWDAFVSLSLINELFFLQHLIKDEFYTDKLCSILYYSKWEM